MRSSRLITVCGMFQKQSWMPSTIIKGYGKMNKNTGDNNKNVRVYLYGKLRSKAAYETPLGEHVIDVPWEEGDRIKNIVERLHLEISELSHIFLNGVYSGPARRVKPGDRLGLFARDMHLLYRQYFPVEEGGDDE